MIHFYLYIKNLKSLVTFSLLLQETFSYSSQYWINMETYSPEDGITGLDDRETKLATFWNTPFRELCVGMKIEKSVKFMAIPYSAKSLYEIIADGYHRPTNISRDTWKSLYVHSSLQRNCGKQGFNVAPERRVRLGILGNNEVDCTSADSFLGFGGVEASKRSYCNVRDRVNSCGNSAYCGTDNGDREVQAMGYIFVR